jgi:hypothetical protein
MKILYALIGLVVIGAGAWFVLGQKEASSEASMQGSETSEPVSTETQAFKGSMQELMARGGSWRCDVSITAEGISSTGTTYVAEGKVRADFVSTMPQVGQVETHMLMLGNTAYTWTSMMNTGFKFPIRGAEADPEVSAEVSAQLNQDYDYRCTAWPTDESKFELPSGITF